MCVGVTTMFASHTNTTAKADVMDMSAHTFTLDSLPGRTITVTHESTFPGLGRLIISIDGKDRFYHLAPDLEGRMPGADSVRELTSG